ncbi:hypothetical protein GGR88_000736 [Sphingomonas jejuensis]|uniref:Uncharacterized protein n=1 Tax=Sphingomonas jejuensis TaxID=904715 RepID=A0ABX0XK81_9SPHN|nr:hypothetical protein [Sphingomonas jejuensis]NJC33262.1 hypothetical protein [Sphingomonas jejuensis]
MIAGRFPLLLMSLAVLSLFGVTAPPVSAQQTSPLVSEGSELVHPGSGYRFPEAYGDLRRTGTTSYAPDNLSVRYGQFDEQISAPYLDVFIYPATVPIHMERAGVEQALVARLNARPIEEDADGEPTGTGRWFEGEFNGVPVLTGYLLQQGRGWLVKVRATGPRDAGDIDRLRAAVAAIDMDGTRRPYKAPR